MNTTTSNITQNLEQILKDIIFVNTSLDGVVLAIGYDHQFVTLFNTQSKIFIKTFKMPEHFEWVQSIAFLKDDVHVAVLTDMNTSYKWSVEADNQTLEQPLSLVEKDFYENMWKSKAQFSQSVVFTNDNYKVEINSSNYLVVSFIQDFQQYIPVMHISSNYFDQDKSYLYCYSDIVVVWKDDRNPLIVDISRVKKQLASR